jgi:hypothetical protein
MTWLLAVGTCLEGQFEGLAILDEECVSPTASPRARRVGREI